jgi:hypothetical protein
VERALTLVSTGTLTIEMARVARGKTVPLPRTLNFSTGRESTRQTGFSDAAWGVTTRNYTKSAHALPRAKFEAIVKAAQVYMKPGRRNLSSGATESVADMDKRACFVTNSGSESGTESDEKSELDEESEQSESELDDEECTLPFSFPSSA